MSKRSILRQTLVTLSSQMLNFHMGTAYAWAASHMKYFLSEEGHGFSYEECTIMASLLHIGRLCAPFSNLIITRRFGRKPVLILASFLMTIASFIQTTYKSALAVNIARYLMGFGIGTYDGYGIIHIGEISSKHIRGAFLAITNVFYVGGILTQYILAYYFTFEVTSIVTAIIAVFHLLFTFFIVESPYYLVEHNQLEKASRILSWLRDTDEKQVEDELKEIASIERVTNYSEFFKSFSKPEVYKSYGIVLTLGMVASALNNIVVTFTNYIIPDTDLVSSYHFAMLICVILLFSAFISTFLVDSFGRRPLLIGSFSFNTVLNGITAALFLIQQYVTEIPYFSWIIFSLVVLHLINYAIGIYPPILATRSELFPPSYKILGVNMCIGLNSITNFLCTIFFMEIIVEYGMYLNYVMFSVVCFIGLIIVYFILPETKGKSLFEIQSMLKSKK